MMVDTHAEPNQWFHLAASIAGVSTLLAILVTARLLAGHYRNWINPKQQTKVMIIIIMVPYFAIMSFIALLEIHANEVTENLLEGVKEIYEAVVIHAFLGLMMDMSGIDENQPIPDSIKGRHVHFSFPLNYLFSNVHMNKKTVKMLKLATLQFVYIRPVLAVLEVLLEILGFYENCHVLFTIGLNISVTIAMYSLLSFYHTFEKELESHKPLAKFLCIKGVVFFAFWQGVVLEALVYMGILHAGHWYDVREVSSGIQNFLVCVEMGMIFTVAHNYAFSHYPYQEEAESLRKRKNE